MIENPREPSSARLAHLLNSILLLGLFCFSGWAYPGLPGRIPVHFNASGNADCWAEKSRGLWFALPIVALGFTGLMYLMSLAVKGARRNSRWLNIPHKAQFLALPPERQAPIWQELGMMFFWLAVPLILLFVFLQVAIWMTAVGKGVPGAFPLATALFAVLEVGTALFLTMKLRRSIRQVIQEHENMVAQLGMTESAS